ncbi:MAG: hypothetical protein PHY56_07405, partial [Candidatus Omnitrophica bacterium]|nr:hypothetical protein [Candidatus Omnitrophota bacterium]
MNKWHSSKDNAGGYICWVDCLSLISLFRVIALCGRYRIKEIRFMRTTALAKKIADRCLRGLFRFKRPYDDGIVDCAAVENKIELTAYKDAIRIIYKLIKPLHRQRYLSLLNKLDKKYNKDKITLFFEQEIWREIIRPVNLCNYAKLSKDYIKGHNIVLITGNSWIDFIRTHFKDDEIEICSYFNLKGFIGLIYYPLKIVIEIIANLFLLFIGKGVSANCDKQHSKTAVLYMHGADLAKKSDYFWLPASGIDPKRIIVYFKYSVRPPTKANINMIEENNATWVNLLPWKIGARNLLSGTMELYRFPSVIFIKKSLKTLWTSLFLFITCLWKGSLWYWKNITNILNSVDFFESFFLAFNIKVHFAQYGVGRDMSAANMAIELVNGVDIGAHWSNFDSAFVDLAKPHDIYFSWGPYFKDNFLNADYNRIDKLVYCGYPYDSFFKDCNERAKSHRGRLLDKGARFIVAFFDQSLASNKPNWVKEIEGVYRFLLEEVLKDETFGLIIKPKKLASLNQKLPAIASLFNKAVSTGRCLFLDADIFPCEAAYASDLALGIGASSTPLTEALLAGVPGITFDSRDFLEHPIYRYDFKNIIQNRLFKLENVIRDVKNNNLAVEKPMALKEIDCFRDGRASLRIGCFIKWVSDEIEKGSFRQEAIKAAI